MQEDVLIGKIVNTHGIRGALKLVPEDPDTQNIQVGKTLYIKEKAYIVKSLSKNKGHFLLTFEGLEDINLVEHFKGCPVTLPEDQLEPLPQGHFYIFELIGLDCYQDGQKIGQVEDVDTSAVNDVFTIKGDKTWRVPNVPAFIKHIDLEAGRIDLVLIEGMADED